MLPLSRRAGVVLTMMYLLGFLSLLSLSACSFITSEESPISDSTMVDMLVDLHLAQVRNASFQDLTLVQRDSILAQYGLDVVRLEEIMRYYADHPERYTTVYSGVMDRLNDERALHQDPMTEIPYLTKDP